MNYFLDTNTCIYFLNGKFDAVRKHLQSTTPNNIKIPAIVKAELLFGAQKSKKKEDNTHKVGAFLLPYDIIPFSDAAAVAYSHIRYEMERAGKPIGPNDLLIASIVLAEKGILVTNNVSEFKRVPNLEITDWTTLEKDE